MTGKELQRSFGVKVNQLTGAINVPSNDIFYWLTEAQKRIIQEAYLQFEVDRRVGDILRPLNERGVLYTIPDTTEDYADKAVLPDDYLYLISLSSHKKGLAKTPVILDYDPNRSEPNRVQITNLDADTYIDTKGVVRLVQQDDIRRLQEDPFHRSSFYNTAGIILNGSVIVYRSSNFFNHSLLLSYIRYPGEVTREKGSDLPEDQHTTLVHNAVELYKQSLIPNNT